MTRGTFFLTSVGFAVVAAPIILGSANTLQQAPTPARPEFEVASVRRNTSGSGSMSSSSRNGRVTITNQTLDSLIRSAFGFKDHLFSGPDWIESERYDVVAKAPDGTPPDDQMNAMMQSLLIDTFKIVFRRETKEVPIYALVVARDGLKMQRLDEAPPTSVSFNGNALRPSTPGLSLSRGAGTMKDFADSLSRTMDRPVVDKTGLSGRYSRSFEYRREDAPPEVIGPSIFTALEEQLGVKLDPDKGLVEYVSIERIERPSEDFQ